MKAAAALCVLSLASWSAAETTYLGLYINDRKVGYSSYDSAPARFEGRATRIGQTKTVMDLGLLGTPMRIQIDSSTWTLPDGKVAAMSFTTESAGRTQRLMARFGGPRVKLTIDNSGAKTTRTLLMPAGPVVDDPMTLVLDGKRARTFFILDPTTASFVKNEITPVGRGKVTVKGRSVDANMFDIVDPRANTRVYISAKGDLLKAEGPLGIMMVPESKRVALTPADKYSPGVDLAYATSVRTDIPIEDPGSLRSLTLRITGKDLSHTPSDAFQSVTRDGASWQVAVHPTTFGGSITVAEARKQQPEWVKPDLNIPSDQPKFIALATKIAGGRSDLKTTTLAIKDWVYGKMRPNAGIGVLRDASEVLKTQEGVCRDYAILTATLLRAAGVPTRLASGLVNWDGTFYYHAWNEVWDGQSWVGVDSTTPDSRVAANHVKLADGTVEQAFTFTVLDRVKVEVLDAKKG